MGYGTSPCSPPYRESRPTKEDGKAVRMGEGGQVTGYWKTARYA